MNLDKFRGSSKRSARRSDSHRSSTRRGVVAVIALTGLVLSGCGSPDTAEPPVENTTSASATASSSTSGGSSASAPSSSTSTPQPIRCQTPSAGDIGKLSHLELVQLATTLMTVGVANYDDAAAAVARGAGGIFIGSWTDMSMLHTPGADLKALQAKADGHLMITIDEEGGRVQRLSGEIGALPTPAEMARTMTPQQVHDLAKGHAEKMVALGLSVDFAPNADVDMPDATTVIGDRAFSDDPKVAAEYAAAFADGLAAGGIKPVVKHFPGHGSVVGDSHAGAVTAPPLPELKKHDLLAFSALTDQPAFMVGHMEVPGFGEPGPASLNPAVYQLLKTGGYPKLDGGDTPAFDGVVFTDDLSGMKAITDRMAVTEAVVKAIAAGADSPLWLGTEQLPAAAEAVATAVEDGTISPDRFADARARVAHFAGCK